MRKDKKTNILVKQKRSTTRKPSKSNTQYFKLKSGAQTEILHLDFLVEVILKVKKSTCTITKDTF